jgi:hypothetical protein
MGLMRRGESRVERSASYVQPTELARKLVKEMEDHKVSHSTQDSVCNLFTVFLCPEDYTRLQERREEITDKLQRHLAKHAHSRRYSVPGDLRITIVRDEDLPLGKFGILAERFDPARATEASVQEREPMRRAAARRGSPPSGGTQVIPTAEAAKLSLAHQSVVLTAGERVREFNKGRVVLGRARDVDFRVDDPNVSRRHAAIYWDEGRVMIQDLESTNGTMINGLPVTNTALRSTDVVTIGDCRITVEIR